MCSHHDLTAPIVSFVGRPLDPNKGLVTFFDALEVLLNLGNCPRFSVWIVGGDSDECDRIKRLIAARPILCSQIRAGQLTVFGKVQRASLPEFYRRSHLVVMPSIREPFGLVAIEAMACGVPVVASRQGGPSDTVLGGLTGAKSEVDEPEALAAAILLYLRSITIRDVRGQLARQWAVSSFGKADAYGRMAHLYEATKVDDIAQPDWDLPDRFHATEVSCRISAVETLLGQRVLTWGVVAARYHVVAKVTTASGDFSLKVYRDRPSLASALLPMGTGFPVRTAHDFVDNATYHAANPLVPKLVAVDRASGFAVHEWVKAEFHDPDGTELKSLIQAFAAYGDKTDRDEPLLHNAYAALERFLTTKDDATLQRLDEAAAAFNGNCQRMSFGNRLLHSGVELQRILMCLGQKTWPLPGDIADRLRMVLNLLLVGPPDPLERPRLQHGDLKRRHMALEGRRSLVFDTEHSTFAMGELDLGTYAAGQVFHGAGVFNILRTIGEASETVDRKLSAVRWMTYFVVHGYLARLHHGKVTEPTRIFRRALSELALALA